MSDIEAFKSLVREVLSPRMRERGFKGSGQRWVKSNDTGDLCVVSLEMDQGYEPFEVLFQAGAVPKVWDNWLRGPYSAGSVGEEITKKPMHYHGMDVWTLIGPGEEIPDFWPVHSPEDAIRYMVSNLGELDRFAEVWLDPQEARRMVDEGKFAPYGYLEGNPLTQETALFLMNPPSSDRAKRAGEALLEYHGLKVWETIFSKTVC